MNSIKRFLLIGATSAIAEQVAREVIQKGNSIYCVARNEEKLNSIVADLRVRANDSQKIGSFVSDLTDFESHSKIIVEAERFLDGIDAVLIAHGSLPNQLECEKEHDKAMQEINLNGLSVISLLTHLGNYFEARSKGVIAVISSVAGDRGRQSNYVYGASKGMISIFMQGLRNRLYHKNVAVITIKPGFVDTPMTSSFEKKGLLWAKPNTVATGIIKAMLKGKNEVYLPKFWFLIMFIIKSIPESIFKRLKL